MKCRLGYTPDEVEAILGPDADLDVFSEWMYGQTMAICDGGPETTWIDDPTAPGGMRLVEVGPPLCSEAHGAVVYPWDLTRFIEGRPVVD